MSIVFIILLPVIFDRHHLCNNNDGVIADIIYCYHYLVLKKGVEYQYINNNGNMNN